MVPRSVKRLVEGGCPPKHTIHIPHFGHGASTTASLIRRVNPRTCARRRRRSNTPSARRLCAASSKWTGPVPRRPRRQRPPSPRPSSTRLHRGAARRVSPLWSSRSCSPCRFPLRTVPIILPLLYAHSVMNLPRMQLSTSKKMRRPPSRAPRLSGPGLTPDASESVLVDSPRARASYLLVSYS